MPAKKSAAKDAVDITEEIPFIDPSDQANHEVTSHATKVSEERVADKQMAQAANEMASAGERKIPEITIKFGKGCLGQPFVGKDGNEYRSVLIPNSDPEDHRPWATFVVRANHVHEDKFGKGMWTKVPAEGHTTIRRGHVVGQDEAGKDIWENVSTKITNQELKAMVEFYKERPRESVKEKLAEKQAEVAASKDTMPKPEKAKAKAIAI